MKKLAFFIGLLNFSMVCAQNDNFKLQNYKPATPAVYEFARYTEMPVNKYTGIPDIAIPLYSIKTDNVVLPLSLRYHAGGIKVNQEASWVGLGWDLSIGCNITQEVNDRDDLAPGVIRERPDWNESPVPSYYIMRIHNYASGNLIENQGWDGPEPIVPAKPFYSYRIYSAFNSDQTSGGTNFTQFVLPFKGLRNNNPIASQILLAPQFDSEPDIFNAQILGKTLKFIIDPNNETKFRILNESEGGGGYKILRNGIGFDILDPSGSVFSFSIVGKTHSGSCGNITECSTSPDPSSKVFYISRIKTRNGQQLNFEYDIQAGAANLPSISQVKRYQLESVRNTLQMSIQYEGVPLPLSGIDHTSVFSAEDRVYLKKITFPNGQIDFASSPRVDLTKGMKLDQITVSSNQISKKFTFSYSHFPVVSPIGNTWQAFGDGALVGGSYNLRLRLDWVREDGQPEYRFRYEPTPLPVKNSFAQDYWGFYNGVLSNTQLTESPTRLLIPNSIDDGNNHSARLEFCQAGTLKEVIYPTGGRSTFEYELNEFNNYWVPDFDNLQNQVSHGKGLRVKKIVFFDRANNVASTKAYEYTGGKAIQKQDLWRTFGVTQIDVRPAFPSAWGAQVFYTITEVSAKGFTSLNSLSSGDHVGYDMVSEKQLDLNGQHNGKIDAYFINMPDHVGNTALAHCQLNANMPSTPYRSLADNGSELKVQYFDRTGQLVRSIENEFAFSILNDDNYNYGAKVFNYSSIYWVSQSPWQVLSLPKMLVAYYPIYSKCTKLIKTKTTEYSIGGSLETVLLYEYDYYGQVSASKRYSSDGNIVRAAFEHTIEYQARTGSTVLRDFNLFSELTGVRVSRISTINGSESETYKYYKTFSVENNSVLLRKVVDFPRATAAFKEVDFPLYSNNGKPLQVSSNGKLSAMIWGYNSEYLVAEIINAGFNEVAYTSFETPEGGGWTVSGIGGLQPFPSMTGRRSYSGTFNHVKHQLVPGKSYVVSYWSRSGAFQTNPVSTSRQGQTVDGWTYFEHTISNNFGSIGLSGSGFIDEMRLYPADAQMVSYTYDPLVGVTSQSDINGKITYYYYDPAWRLSHIKDQEGFVLKRFCYNYFGQPEDCGGDPAPQWVSTGEFQCRPCDQSPIHSSNIRERLERDLNPSSPTYNQTRWVLEGPSSSCHAAEDWQIVGTGLCLKDELNQNTGFVEFIEQDHNPCSITFNQTRSTVGFAPVICPSRQQCGGAGSSCGMLLEGWECIRDACEYGKKVYTDRIEREGGQFVVYHYEYSDGSWSRNYERTMGPDWITLDSSDCMPDDEGRPTGFRTITQMDINPFSENYREQRTVVIHAPAACELACSCSDQGEGWACIRGQCEEGRLIFTAFVNGPNGSYCIYHYEYTDGSWSRDYNRLSTQPCTNN